MDPSLPILSALLKAPACHPCWLVVARGVCGCDEENMEQRQKENEAEKKENVCLFGDYLGKTREALLA